MGADRLPHWGARWSRVRWIERVRREKARTNEEGQNLVVQNNTVESLLKRVETKHIGICIRRTLHQLERNPHVVAFAVVLKRNPHGGRMFDPTGTARCVGRERGWWRRTDYTVRDDKRVDGGIYGIEHGVAVATRKGEYDLQAALDETTCETLELGVVRKGEGRAWKLEVTMLRLLMLWRH